MTRNCSDDTLALVGAGAMADGYLRAAQEAGLRVGVVETAGRCAELTERYSCVVDTETLHGPAVRDETWLPPAMALVDRLRPGAVLGFAEPQVLAAAVVQHRLGVPGPGLDAAVISRNKAMQRGEFRRAGLPHPDHVLVPALAMAEEWALQRLPVVVKPLAHQGSQGVERIDTQDRWHDTVRRRSAEGALLVEQYVEGPEYSVEALVEAGRVLFTNLTRKETTEAPHFVEMLHEAGHGSVQPTLGEAARKLCTAVVATLRVQTGIVHLEFRAPAEDHLVIMEVAVRTPGDNIMEIACRANRTDLYAAAVRLAFGSTPILLETPSCRATAAVYLAADRAGTLDSLDLSAWSDIPQVVRSYALQEPGTQVRPPESSEDRLAYALLDCETHPELTTLVNRLRTSADFTITQ